MPDPSTLTLEALVSKAGELQMIPAVARKVIELVADANVSAEKLASVLEKDSALTGRILKISNSSFYGMKRQVTSIHSAIVILGFKNLRSLAIASSSKAIHKKFGPLEQGMWDLSVATAVGGRSLAGSFPTSVQELSFVAGLMHNTGQAIMNNELPKLYERVVEESKSQTKLKSEVEIFGYTHLQVGWEVTKKWGLPSEIAQAIRFYALSNLTNEDSSEVEKLDPNLVKSFACVEVAQHIARSLGIGCPKPETLDIAALKGFQILGLDSEKLAVQTERLKEAYEKESSVFN